MQMNDIQNVDVSKQEQQIPVFDKGKQYPKKIIKREITEEIYIPLETTPEVLLDQDAVLIYVSNNRMLVFNCKIGDIFIFGMDGKALFNFNRRGPDGYSFIKSVIYDEKNKEVIVLDEFTRKIFVFSEEGVYKRILHTPLSIRPTEIYNYDEKSILVFDEKQHTSQTPVMRITPTQPFTLHSKEDGTIISKINITMEKVLAKSMFIRIDRNTSRGYKNTITLPNNSKFGNEFIFHDFSLDTIYHLREDKTLVPLFVQSPSVFSERPKIVCVGLLSDKFIAFSMYHWDVLEQIRQQDRGKEVKFYEKFFIFDFIEKQFYEIASVLGTWGKIEIDKNKSAQLIDADIMIQSYKVGRLTGDVKKIAQKLKEEDNQVVKITKYK